MMVIIGTLRENFIYFKKQDIFAPNYETMKRYLFFILLLYSTFSLAQSKQIGFFAGINASTQNDQKIIFGPKIGLEGCFKPFKSNNYLSFNTWIVLSSKGYESDWRYSENTKKFFKWRTRLYYIDIPIHLGYERNLSKNIDFRATLGPYIGIGLWGKTKVKEKETKKEEIFSDNVFNDAQYKRLDIGISSSVGFLYQKKILLSIGYELGLRDLRTSDLLTEIKNKNIYLSTTFFF